MSSHKKGKKEALLTNQGVATLLALTAVALVAIYIADKNDWFRSKPTTTVERSCEAWEARYAVIPWNEFPGDTLRVGWGEHWLIRLHPAEESGWVVLHPKGSTFPTGEAEMLFSDGLRITDAPGRDIGRGGRNTFRARGDGCLLVDGGGA